MHTIDDLTLQPVEGLIAFYLHPGAGAVVRSQVGWDEPSAHWVADWEPVAGRLLGDYYSTDRHAAGFFNLAAGGSVTFLGVCRAEDEDAVFAALSRAAAGFAEALALMQPGLERDPQA